MKRLKELGGTNPKNQIAVPSIGHSGKNLPGPTGVLLPGYPQCGKTGVLNFAIYIIILEKGKFSLEQTIVYLGSVKHGNSVFHSNKILKRMFV